MNTKSSIQILAELMDAKYKFFEHLSEINEKYEVVDNVFACDVNGVATELKEGYYGEVATFDTLEEAAKDFNICLQGLRVHDGKFSVGNLYPHLSMVTESVIIDLEESKIL